MRSVLLYLFGGELRPGVQVSRVDDIDPSREDGREEGGMVECDSISEVREDGGVDRCWCEEIDGMWHGGTEWKAYIVQWLGWVVAGAGDQCRLLGV